jgi:hypothetical protein
MARHTFIVSDESVLNSYGFRIMTAGGNFEQYRKNPIVLWMHKRPRQWKETNNDEEIFPIGLGYDLRIKNGQLLVDVEFDQKDEFAQKIEQKVESGHIRMASPGIEPVTWTSDPKYLLAGQKNETLLAWKLVEISIVDIGSNPNALKLYNSNTEVIELTAGNENDFIPLLKNTKTNNKSMEFLQQVAVLLGKEPDAAQESVMTALKNQLQLAQQASDYKTKYETLNQEVTQMREANLVSLVDANQDKKFTADKREMYLSLGRTSGFEALKNLFEAMPLMKSPSSVINLTKTSGSETETGEVKTFSDLKKLGMDAVTKLRKEDPAEYIRLYKAEYGVEPKLNDNE